MWWALAINVAARRDGGRRDPRPTRWRCLPTPATCSPTSARSGSACSRRGSPRVAPTPARTFGLQRSEILGALVNGVALLAISVLIVVGAITRLSDPPDVDGRGGAGDGLVGSSATGRDVGARRGRAPGHQPRGGAAPLGGGRAQLARRGRRGRVVLATGWNTIDPLVSLLIAALIAAGSWRLLKEPFDVLMEAAPAGIDVGRWAAAMAPEADVVEVHDLHIWSVTSGFPALAAHVVVERDRSRPRAAPGREAAGRALRDPAHHPPGGRAAGPTRA